MQNYKKEKLSIVQLVNYELINYVDLEYKKIHLISFS